MLTATFGVVGAFAAYVLGLRSARYSIMPISLGFLAGGFVGWAVFEGTYRGPWEARQSAALAVEAALPATLLALSVYHRWKTNVRPVK